VWRRNSPASKPTSVLRLQPVDSVWWAVVLAISRARPCSLWVLPSVRLSGSAGARGGSTGETGVWSWRRKLLTILERSCGAGASWRSPQTYAGPPALSRRRVWRRSLHTDCVLTRLEVWRRSRIAVAISWCRGSRKLAVVALRISARIWSVGGFEIPARRAAMMACSGVTVTGFLGFMRFLGLIFVESCHRGWDRRCPRV